MKTMDISVFISVFQEMLGVWLWIMLITAAAGIIGFVLLMVKEHGLVSKRFVAAEVFGLFGGVLALIIMAQVSSSGFTDAGGPADWFLIVLVYGAGFIASIILTYVVMGLFSKTIQPHTTT